MAADSLKKSYGKKSILDTRINGFYVLFVLFAVTQYLTRINFDEAFLSAVNSAMDVVRAIILIMLLAFALIRRIKNIDMLVRDSALLIIAALTWIVGGSSHLFWIVAFILAAGKIRISEVAKLVFVTTLAIIILTIALWQLGIVGEPILPNADYRTRSTFGFGHPNALGLMLFLVFFSYSVRHFGRLPLMESALCLVSLFVIIYYADSRTYALVTALWLMLLWMYHLFVSGKNYSKFLPVVLLVAFVGLCVVSMFLMANYDSGSSLQSSLNSLLSGRLRLMHAYYLESPLSLFGFDYEGSPPQYSGGVPYSFLVDNAYGYVYLRFGISGALLVLFGMLCFIRRSFEEHYTGVLLYGLLFFTLIAFVEGSVYQMACNFFLLAFSALSTGQPLADIDDVSDGIRQEALVNGVDNE